MRSKLITGVTTLGLFFIAACNDNQGSSQSPIIGVPLQQAYSAFTGSVGTAYDANEAVYLDSNNRQVVIFQVEPFDVVSTLELPPTVDSEAFFSGKNSQFFILKEKKGFGILKRNGDYLISPVPMFGEITAVSYDFTSGRLIVQDDLSSVALVRLSDNGDVIASWIGGPVLDGENGILVGTLLRNGTIAVSMTDTKLAKIDFDASLAGGSWVYTRFDFPTGSVPENDEELPTKQPDMNWLSPVDALDQIVLARTNNAIYTIDFDTMAVVDSMILAAGETGLHFNRNAGHVIVSNSGQSSHDLVHAGPDGKLLRKKIHNISAAGVDVNRGVEFSVMDAMSGTLTIMAGYDGQRTIYRNRLSDGLFVGAVKVESFERTVLTSQHVIEILDYVLGKAVRTEIQNPDQKVEVQAYNLRQAR